MKETGTMLKKLLEMIEKTETQEMDCDAVFDILDIYAEAVVRGEEINEMLSVVRRHLNICHCCSEEYEALMRILETQGL